jgi:hypothetical protein
MLKTKVQELSGEEAKRQLNDLLCLLYYDGMETEEIKELYRDIVPELPVDRRPRGLAYETWWTDC